EAKAAVLIGDKGYVGLNLQNTETVALSRKNSKSKSLPTPLKRKIFTMRRRVETTFSQLCDTLNAQKVFAKSFRGLCTRIRLKILSFLIAVYVNLLNQKDNILLVKYALFY
ncbi:MAG: IS982 family transposase, partial [Clostridiales bacterium]|nr:IS982 family transposase [Clostridiales bacterium]